MAFSVEKGITILCTGFKIQCAGIGALAECRAGCGWGLSRKAVCKLATTPCVMANQLSSNARRGLDVTTSKGLKTIKNADPLITYARITCVTGTAQALTIAEPLTHGGATVHFKTGFGNGEGVGWAHLELRGDTLQTHGHPTQPSRELSTRIAHLESALTPTSTHALFGRD